MGNAKNREDALREIFKDVDKIVEEVVQDAGKKARKDIKNAGNNAIRQYYMNYTPEEYDRTYQLYKTMSSYNQSKGNVVKAYVQFDSRTLAGAYSSNSRYHQKGNNWTSVPWGNGSAPLGDYGVVQPDWIFNEVFFEGHHPVSHGNRRNGYTYDPIVDPKSPYELLSDFVDDYAEIELPKYINELFGQKIISRL